MPRLNIAFADFLQKIPNLKVWVGNIVNLMNLQSQNDYLDGLSEKEFYSLFTCGDGTPEI